MLTCPFAGPQMKEGSRDPCIGEESLGEVCPRETANALPGIILCCLSVVLPKGGDRLNGCDLHMDEFVTWLCQHEYAIVGRPRSCYHSPLACWLSDFLEDGVYGIDGQWYGRALHDTRFWQLLPRWAVLFTSWMESVTSLPVTGFEALEVLAWVELALRSCAA